jgi:hypothetical protein
MTAIRKDVGWAVDGIESWWIPDPAVRVAKVRRSRLKAPPGGNQLM